MNGFFACREQVFLRHRNKFIKLISELIFNFRKTIKWQFIATHTTQGVCTNGTAELLCACGLCCVCRYGVLNPIQSDEYIRNCGTKVKNGRETFVNDVAYFSSPKWLSVFRKRFLFSSAFAFCVCRLVGCRRSGDRTENRPSTKKANPCARVEHLQHAL